MHLFIHNQSDYSRHQYALPPFLHDALPIFDPATTKFDPAIAAPALITRRQTLYILDVQKDQPIVILPYSTSRIATALLVIDRKSTRLNSSHRCISYAVFCLKKTNKESTKGK